MYMMPDTAIICEEIVDMCNITECLQKQKYCNNTRKFWPSWQCIQVDRVRKTQSSLDTPVT